MAFMRRKLYAELVAWKDGGAKKPLMVIGARQVGKTSLIEKFCEAEFKDSVVLNLADRQDVVDLFEMPINTQDKVNRLRLLVGRAFDFEKTVLFFDEVQKSERLIEALKYFAEQETRFKIICAGSLLGVKINRFKASFPVGKVHTVHMYPMDFEEFLWALEKTLVTDEIRRCFETNEGVLASLHEQWLDIYRSYLCIGGMPEAVLDYAAVGADVLRFDQTIHKDIHESYVNDMSKYIASPLESSRIEAIYGSIPSQLANKSRKFQYSNIRKGARARSYETALQWLRACEMIYRCAMVSAPNMPLKGFEEPDYFKLYLNDVGLLANLLDLPLVDIMLGKDLTFKGVIAENYVAQQLIAAGIPLHYWRNKNHTEIDFLLQTADGVIPLEVSAGTHKAAPALTAFCDRYKPRYAVKVSANNFGCANGIKSVPLYAAFCLAGL